MTILSFSATVTVGQLRYVHDLLRVEVGLALGPGVGSARVSLPRDLRVDAQPGDDAVIELAGEGDSPVTVFTGQLLSVRRGLDETTLICGDAAATMSGARSGSTFEHQGAAAIVRALARESGADVGRVELDLDLPTFVAHQGRTSWEHITTLAAWAGASAAVDASGAVEVRAFPSPPADLALRYGREIAELSVTKPAPRSNQQLTGNGPAGNAADPRAHLQATATLPSGASGPDAHTVRVPAPALRTAAAVATANRSAAEQSGPRLRATCWLVPELRAGMTVEIAAAPTPGSPGPWLLTRVSHQVGPAPLGRTTLTGRSLEAPGSGLLGRLAGAVGSLL